MSVFGLVISLLTAILPLFTRSIITGLFINEKIAAPISFLSFMLGVAVFWQINQTQLILFSISFGPINQSTGLKKFNLSGGPLLFSIVVICAFLGFAFLSIKQFSYIGVWITVMGVIQGLTYLLFFVFLILLFSVLYKQTHSFYSYRQQRENFSSQVTETLEKNGILKPRIEILENRQLSNQELLAFGIANVFIARKITIKEKRSTSSFVISLDGKELIKKI